MKVEFVYLEEDETENILFSKEFQGIDSMFSSDIDDFVYKNVLELDKKYDFIDYENAPTIEIRYYSKNDKIVFIDNCVNYMYNL